MSEWLMVVEVGLSDPPSAASPTWTDISGAVLAGDGVSLTRGATGGEQAGAGQCSFTIDGDRLAGLGLPALSGPTLLRRPLRFRALVDGIHYPLGRFHGTDVVETRDGGRRLRVTGTDAFALWEESKRGGDEAWHLAQCGAVRRWRLDDEGPVARDTYRGVELSEVLVDDPPASPSYGEVIFGQGALPPPSGAGVVRFEPVDAEDGGFTGLAGQLPGGLPFGLSFWMRMPEAVPRSVPWAPTMVALELTPADRSARPRVFGFDGGYCVHSAGRRSPGYGPQVQQIGWGWVHVDYRVGVSSSSVTVRTVDGDATVLAGVDHDWEDYPGGFTGITLGGSRFLDSMGLRGYDPALCELSDIVVWSGVGAESGMFAAALGWPGESAGDRLARASSEAGWAAPSMSAVPVAMTSTADSRTSLAEGLREVETVALGLLHLRADGSAAVLTRAELEGAASVGELSAAQLLRDADGVATNTSYLGNASTVSGVHAQVSATASNAASVAAWGERADDRQMATADADWLALSAGWLANRAASPSAAFGLPNLVVGPRSMPTTPTLPGEDVLPDGDLWPGGTGGGLLALTTDIGDVLTVTDVLDDPIDVQVWGVSWSVTGSGGWRCSWSVRPHGTTDWFHVDTDSVDGPAIVGW